MTVETGPPSKENASRSGPRLDFVVTILMAVVTIGLLGYVIRNEYFRPAVVRVDPPLPKDPVSVDDAAAKGDLRAPLLLIEYSDFHCSACLRFARLTGPYLDEHYVKPGKLRRVYRQFPAALSDELGIKTAEAAACTARQGKFWQLHDVLFARDQDPRGEGISAGLAHVKALAASVGVNDIAFSQCLNDLGRRDVLVDVGSGRLLDVSATPTLFIGRMQPDGRVRLVKRIVGAISGAEFAPMLDSMLSQTGADASTAPPIPRRIDRR